MAAPANFPFKVFTENEFQLVENESDWASLLERFEYIRAAGGIVRNAAADVLMIHRRGKWDFPKGKVEAGEAVPEAALREVEEETGIRAEIADNEPVSVFHTYDTYGTPMLKETFWFKMRALENQECVPQAEEDIAEAVWVPESQVRELLRNSYASLREVAELTN